MQACRSSIEFADDEGCFSASSLGLSGQGEHGRLAERPALSQKPHILSDPLRAPLGVGDVMQAIKDAEVTGDFNTLIVKSE
jgi:hypothetical protein